LNLKKYARTPAISGFMIGEGEVRGFVAYLQNLGIFSRGKRERKVIFKKWV